MRIPSSFKILTTVACLVTMTGCKQYYTGGLGLSDDQRKQVQQYAAEHHNKKQPAPTAAADPVLTPAAAPGSYLDTPHPHANLSPNALAQMNLFGQLQGKASPRPKSVAVNAQPITFAHIGANFDPHVSPDGKSILYASTSHSRTADIFVKRVGSTAITQLTDDAANDVMPVFSPDGKQIAFCSDRSGNWDLYIMNAAGGQAMQLTDDPTDELHPSFSPDGKQLVYCSYGSATNQWELIVIDLANPNAKHIIGRGLFPSWSPDGQQILFQRARQRGTRWFSVWAVNYANEQASSPTELASSPDAAVITPAWSPDGKHIVFCTVRNSAADAYACRQADIWVMNADGSSRARLTQGQFLNLEPTWAPDGTIYFVSNRAKDGIENVWALKADQALSLAQSSAPDANH